jgi:hypothetical protein
MNIIYMNIILGTCRLVPYANNPMSSIVSSKLSRPTNTKEHLQLIKYIKYNNLTKDNLYFCFEYIVFIIKDYLIIT